MVGRVDSRMGGVDPQLPAVSVRSREGRNERQRACLDYCLPDSVSVWLDLPMEDGVPGSLSIWSSRSMRALIAF